MPYVHVVFTLPHALLPLGYRNATQLYTSCSRRVRPHSWRSPPTRGISVQKSASSAFCIHGDRRCSAIHTSIASFRRADCRPIIVGGFVRDSRILPTCEGPRVGSSAASSWPDYVERTARRTPLRWPHRHLRDPASGRVFDGSFRPIGWCTPNQLSAGPHGAALPRPLHPSRRHQQSRLFAFDGERVTFRWKDYAHGISQRTMTLTARNSSGASSSTCCRGALSAFGSVASWPTLSLRTSRTRSAPVPTTSATSPETYFDTPTWHVRTVERRLSSARYSRRFNSPWSRSLSTSHGATDVVLIGVRVDVVPRVGRVRARPAFRARCIGCRIRTLDSRPGLSPLTRQRPLGRRRPPREDPDSSSIAGRRASGFLQVSLSKVPRPRHRAWDQLFAPRHFRSTLATYEE